MQGMSATIDRATITASGIALRVLVVDADADTRALYRDALNAVACEVLEASDGRDALTKALVHLPALVITELRLPFVDGYALCEILRRDVATRSVPILIVTAEAGPTALNRIRHAGASAVIVKPTTPDAVLHEVRHLTDAHGNQDAVAPCERTSNADAERRRTMRVKSHPRFRTSTPPTPPPALTCPSCDVPLTYEHSYVGGVNDRNPEQWDYYACHTCGTFQYRQRTRKVRRIA
jgi:two-component system chemotaxis response regulator CheY